MKMNVLSLQYHWSPIITEEIENEVLIDLLPQVHRKAYTKLDNVVEVGFGKLKIKHQLVIMEKQLKVILLDF